MEKLCIEEGKLAWCLNLDLTCLDYDGNVAEACVLAATAALAGLTLPRVTTEEGKINVLLDRDRAEVTTGPLAATFAVLADDVIVVDPTHEEECLAEETFTVVLAANGNICGVHKPGGSFLGIEQINKYLELAKELVKDTQILLKTALSNTEQCFEPEIND